MSYSLVVFALAPVAALAILYPVCIVKKIVHEYEAGLLYRNGRLLRSTGAGVYRLCRFWSELRTIDIRRASVTVPGQEVLSADNVGLKVSVAVSYRVADPQRAVHTVSDYLAELYLTVQLAVRSTVAEAKIDEVLENRLQIGKKVLERVAPQAEAMGLELYSLDVKDVMFPGDLKKIFAEVVRAQKEGQAALERARGETAALRSLANAAKMLEGNPNLLSLRTLQAIASLGSSPGNTVVFGNTHGLLPVGDKVRNDHESRSDPTA